MTTDQFWQVIAASRAQAGDGCGAQVEWLRSHLEGADFDTVAGFERELQDAMHASYRWDIWHAAYVALGGCGDDGFDYFRAWLIVQGREAFEAVLANPDALAAHLPSNVNEMECEPLLGVSYGVLGEEATARLASRVPTQPADPHGAEFDFDDESEARRRLPNLLEELERRDA